MEKLIPALQQLTIKSRLLAFHLTTTSKNYEVYLLVKRDDDDIKKYNVRVVFRNLLTSTPGYKASPKELTNDYVFLDDVRQEIIKDTEKYLESALLAVKENKGDYDLEETYDKQEKVMAEYCRSAQLTKEESIALHMFFSPNRVVAGMTNEEVRMCIMMYPFRKKQCDLHPGFFPPPLHPSLITDIDSKISRTEGLKNAIYHLLADSADRKVFSGS